MLDAYTFEFFDLVSARFDHTTNLSIFTLLEDDTKRVGADSLDLTWLSLYEFLGSEGWLWR